MEIRRLVSVAATQGSIESSTIEQRFGAFEAAADQFIEAWARLGSRLDSVINTDCKSMALQLIESVETVRLAWIIRATDLSGNHAGLSEAVESVIMAGQGFAAALSTTVVARPTLVRAQVR
jgi:hypothetical protein